jgi:RecJ-like exonuclease
MKTKFIKECNTCCGSGTVTLNDSWDEHPSRDYSITCDECQGEGECIDQEAIIEIECKIEDVEYMIDGMLTRIRTTSDNIKMCAKFEMLPDFVARYKNTLHTQARALARLETYCANLKSYIS